MVAHRRSAQLGVFLRPEPGRSLRVGTLVRDANGAVTFDVDQSFIGLGVNRPVVSLAWKSKAEDETVQRLLSRNDKMMRGGLLPVFFQNMLPEGALRDLVNSTFGESQFDNFDVLARLGNDLPGAIVVVHESGEIAKPTQQVADAHPKIEEITRFSLAGVQLKFSVVRDRDSLTLPFTHQTGEIILKTPSPRYKFLPEAEMAALELAAAAGVRTAKAYLVDRDIVKGIPTRFLEAGQFCLAVQRFDRGPNGRRIHIEDLAQIYGAFGEAKYSTGNDATIMKTANRFSTDARGEALESLRRIIVNVLIGNGDAHLKNWSFIYPDIDRISLSPAYDIVPTFLFGDNLMALKLGGTNNPYIMGIKRFERAAALAGIPEEVVVKTIRQTVESALDTWPSLLAQSRLPKDMQTALLDRLPKLALVSDLTSKYAVGFSGRPANPPEEDAAAQKM